MPIEGLDELTSKGQELLDADDAVAAHRDFTRWVEEVRDWLSQNFPNSGLTGDWLALNISNLVLGGGYYDSPSAWATFRNYVLRRLRWLGDLPGQVQLKRLLAPAAVQERAQAAGRREVKLQTVSRAYVDPDRISQLSEISSDEFDLCKLVRLCEELNICFAGECYLAMIMMTRAILDHVPPIFGCATFAEVANNYRGGKSLKEAAQQLEASSRKIADHYLHGQVRASEVLPNAVQVDFSNSLDLVLAEIVRLLK
jgi:hypothetical protein